MDTSKNLITMRIRFSRTKNIIIADSGDVLHVFVAIHPSDVDPQLYDHYMVPAPESMMTSEGEMTGDLDISGLTVQQVLKAIKAM